MLSYDDVVKIIYNKFYYEQKLISVIDEKSKQILVKDHIELHHYSNNTIKIEGMEKYSDTFWKKCQQFAKKYSHTGPVTCHVFISKEGSLSFPLHFDPDDVIIYCCNGVKNLVVDNKEIELKAGDQIYIPAKTPHQAINKFSSITLSFGLEKFFVEKEKDYELDVLFKNN